MAIEWIKWIKGLANKREVLLISAELGIDRHEVAGRLMVLWEWCDENITEHEVDDKGNAMVTLGALPERTINSIVGVTGFAEAMANAQWLRLANTGATFPNFARHNGETAKSRALTAKRVARHKQKGNASANDEVTPPALPNALPRIEEKRREDNKYKKPRFDPKEVQLPEPLQTVAFRQAWSDWCEARRENGKPLKPKAVEGQLRQCAEWGEQKAIDSIRASIANQWTGLFAAKVNQPTPPKPKQKRPRLMTQEEIDHYNKTGELPPDALDPL